MQWMAQYTVHKKASMIYLFSGTIGLEKGTQHLKVASKPTCLLIFSQTIQLEEVAKFCKLWATPPVTDPSILVHAKVSKTMVKVWSGVPSQPLLPFPDSPHTTEV